MQEYVVHRLAAFDRLVWVQKALRKEYGVDLAHQSVALYDPTRHAGSQLSEKWKAIFFATREALLEGLAQIGASYPLVRIRWRERMALDAMEAGDSPLANDIFDSIAKEVGDLANRHRHEHSAANGMAANGVPLVATINISGFPEPEDESQAVAGVQ